MEAQERTVSRGPDCSPNVTAEFKRCKRCVNGRATTARPHGRRRSRVGTCTSGCPSSSRTRVVQRPDHAGLRRTICASPVRPNRSASTRSGASSTTSPTTRCAPTSCSSSPTWPACTERIQLGSMVCVLPWHDPMRVAEQIVDARRHVGRPGRSSASAAAPAGSSSTASGSRCPRPAPVSPRRPT